MKKSKSITNFFNTFMKTTSIAFSNILGSINDKINVELLHKRIQIPLIITNHWAMGLK